MYGWVHVVIDSDGISQTLFFYFALVKQKKRIKRETKIGILETNDKK